MFIRPAAERRITRRRVDSMASIQVPVLGWNTRDRLLEDKRHAPVLTNLVPESGRLVMRKGSAEHATDMPAEAVETLMEYSAGTTRKLFAVCDGNIYDVTSAGAVSSAAVSGLGNSRFQHIMHATTSGQYLVAVNGADGVRTYDGSSWANQTINNVTAANLIAVTAHQERLWFVEKDTLHAWYLATYAISGDAFKFDLGPLCSRGGALLSLSTWTIDGGAGPEDYLGFLTDKGEVIIYAGTDPASAATWSLVGVYKIAEPIGRRCCIKYGGDLAILTSSGVVLMSQVLGKVDERDGFSDKIRAEFVSAYAEGGTLYGWEMALYSRRGWLVVNIPKTGGQNDQYAYTVVGGAWFKMSGMGAVCWSESGGDLYFGTMDGEVYKADTGTSDNAAAIEVDFQPSWSRYGTPLQKHFKMVRPLLFTDGSLTVSVTMKVDYDDSPATTAITVFDAAEGAEWDAEDWDEAVWAGGFVASARWTTATGIGIVAAPRVKLQTATASLALAGFDVAYEIAGIV